MKQETRLEKWSAFWTMRRLRLMLAFLFALSLVPILWIGHYNYPSADDFSEGAAVRLAFVHTGSLPAALAAAVAETFRYYRVWMGYFGSMFLTVLQPAAFGEHGYRITIWLVLAALLVGGFVFCRGLFVRLLGADRPEADIVTILILFTGIQRMPGRNEGLFWYSGAVNYMVMFGLSLLLLGLVFDLLSREKAGAVRMVLIGLLAFFCGGGNYLTALSVEVVLAALLLILFLCGKRALLKRAAIPAVCFTVGFLASCLAPGNRVRGANLSGMPPVSAILASFRSFFTLCVGQWTDFTFLCLLTIAVPFLVRLARQAFSRGKFSFPLPGVATLAAVCLSAAAMTPAYYAGGNIEAGRIQAAVYWQYLVLVYLTTFYWAGWLVVYARKRGFRLQGAGVEADGECLPKRHFASLLALCALFVLLSLGSLLVDPDYYTASAAARDLRNGKAAAYAAVMEERIALLSGDAQDVVLPRLEVFSSLLYFSDVTGNVDEWQNQGMARFYEKNSVRLAEPGERPSARSFE